MTKISNHRKRRVELLGLITLCEKYKHAVLKDFNKLNDYHGRGFISVKQYYDELRAKFGDRHAEDWIDYYDRCIAYYRHELSVYERKISEVRNRRVVLPLVVIFALLMFTGIGVLWSNPSIFGFAVYEPGEIVNDTVGMNLTGLVYDAAESNVTALLKEKSYSTLLSEFASEEGVAKIDLSRFNIAAENGTLALQIVYNDSVLAEQYLEVTVVEKVDEETVMPILAPKVQEVVVEETGVDKIRAKVKSRPHSDKVEIRELSSREGKFDVDIDLVMEGLVKGRVRLEGLGDVNELDTVQFDKIHDDGVKRGRITTHVVALRSANVTNARITLSKNGNVNAIMKCVDWDYDSFKCNEWVQTDMAFDDDGEKITFEASGFGAYAGAELTVLNVQSYPFVGGNWTVMFTTVGTADLIIKAVNGTTWSDSDENEDLTFLEVRCGDEVKQYGWVNDEVVIANYACNATGYEVSKVLTSGKHHLQFVFGEDVGYANNEVVPPDIYFDEGTPENGMTTDTTNIYVNVTVNDASDISAFMDWNYSLVGYWAMDFYNSSGVFDNSTYNNFGTFEGGLGTSNITTGKYGQALSFDGVNDYVSIPDNDAFSFTTGSSDKPFTLFAWVYYISPSSNVNNPTFPILSKYNDFSSWSGEWDMDIMSQSVLGGGGSDQLAAQVLDGGAQNRLRIESQTSIPRNQWTQVALVYDGTGVDTGLHLYQDGSEMSVDRATQGSYAYMDNLAGSVDIGTVLRNNADYYAYGKGIIDEVSIYNRALSPEEINASYNAGLYRLETNFTNLTAGTYDYTAYAIDVAGNFNQTETRNITITTASGNQPPTIVDIFVAPSIDPVDGTDVNVDFSFLADDQDGISQFVNASANATFTLDASGVGSGMQLNDTLCDPSDTGNNASVQNYTCSITMRYWDRASDWSVNVTISDSASQAPTYNETFTYNSLTAINMTPSSMAWAQVTLLSTDQLSISNPIIIGNTGNYNVSVGNINISAVDLGGETNTNEFITANNFSINIVNACNSGNPLQNRSVGDTAVIGAGLPTGLDVGERASDELLYICLEELPYGISQQSYSTVNVGVWTIGVT